MPLSMIFSLRALGSVYFSGTHDAGHAFPGEHGGGGGGGDGEADGGGGGSGLGGGDGGWAVQNS